jgi:hypothetical protein
MAKHEHQFATTHFVHQLTLMHPPRSLRLVGTKVNLASNQSGIAQDVLLSVINKLIDEASVTGNRERTWNKTIVIRSVITVGTSGPIGVFKLRVRLPESIISIHLNEIRRCGNLGCIHATLYDINVRRRITFIAIPYNGVLKMSTLRSNGSPTILIPFSQSIP